MKPSISLYLAGKIKKKHEIANEAYWTDEDLGKIQEALADFDVSLLNPAQRTDDLSDEKSVFGRDMFQVFASDVVFVDARDRRGLGVGAEMMWAKFHQIPVVCLAPMDTHYRLKNGKILDTEVDLYIHPFVAALSDFIAQDIEDACDWMRKFKHGRVEQIKDVTYMYEAIKYYKESQYEKDIPMQELLSKNVTLQEKINHEVLV